MEKHSKIYVAGHEGMVGSAVVRALESEGFRDLVLRSRLELNLRNQSKVSRFFTEVKPEYVILAAARVGGIKANRESQADFLYDNLMIASNVIHQAWSHEARKLCYLGSSCMFPRDCPQPMRPEHLLTGSLEPTNEGFAVAKIAGYKLAYYYAKQHGLNTISVMPCNLYGTNDCFDLDKSHVLSAMVKRFVDATEDGDSEVTLWGTGNALREFMNVDDLAKAIVMLMQTHQDPELITLGSGQEITINDLAQKIANAAGFNGKINWDTSKPDGMPRKMMDSTFARQLGCKADITLDAGIAALIQEYRNLTKTAR